MEASDTFKNPHVAATLHQNQTSKPSNYLCNFFIIILVLLFIPLIPSQAPDFVTRSSIFTKLWELFHLMLIGLAVCYGLFSRKSSNVDLENHSRNDTSSQAYLNGILDTSSFFEDGVENLCGYDEKRLILQSSLSVNKHRSLLYENGAQNSCDFDEKKEIKSWNSKYFRGESVVVVANGEYVVDEWGKPVAKIEHKPLNLPVRSLRSRVKDANKPDKNDVFGSNLSSEEPYESDAKADGRKIRGMVPINLEKRFEKVSGPAPIPWRSRSGRMEMREEISKAKPPSHARPHSVGEFDFESLESRSLRHPISSITNSKSSASSELSPRNADMENMEREKDLKGSTITVPEPRMDGGASFVASKSSRHSSIGSSDEMMSIQRNDKETLMESGKSVVEQSLGSDKPRWDFFDSDVKSSPPAKVLSRGKSVRTFRSRKHVLDEVKMKENNSHSVDENAGIMCGEIQTASFIEEVNGEKPENPLVSAKKPILDSICSMPKPTFSEPQSEDKQDFRESSSSETSEENSASQSDSFKVSSDEEAGADLEGSEVDRKAGEFIAKFREQIRLQKVASIKRYRD